jgi:hypothetical protein
LRSAGASSFRCKKVLLVAGFRGTGCLRGEVAFAEFAVEEIED